jgi:hypothetical protein
MFAQFHTTEFNLSPGSVALCTRICARIMVFLFADPVYTEVCEFADLARQTAPDLISNERSRNP